MQGLRRIWQLPGVGEDERRLATSLDLPLALATAYRRRHEDVHILFEPPTKHLHDPFALPDMATAVERILTAVQQGERILIYGDYDVDGLSATLLVKEILEDLGAENVFHYIPERLREGYGVHTTVVEERSRSAELMITVDCGISSHEAISRAVGLGMDVIVTDHHRPFASLPPAQAVICPLREDSLYPFRGLAGVGVAYKLAEALHLARGQSRPQGVLDLVALGTLADQVPLIGENRALVQLGLRAMNSHLRPGLAGLLQSAKLEAPIDAEGIAFRLAPRLNAAGRLGAADSALALLATADEARAGSLAGELEQLNVQRQEWESRVVDEAEAILRASPRHDEGPVLVLAKEGWHIGVLGIAASRLASSYARPVVLLTLEGQTARGSARSAGGFDLHKALTEVSDVLTTFGGHAGAAGLALDGDKVDSLREGLGAIARRRPPRHWLPVLELDGEVKLGELSQDFIRHLDFLQPFGEGNPVPLFMARRLLASGIKEIGQDRSHLSFTLTDAGGCRLGAVSFRSAGRKHELEGELDIAFRPVLQRFRGRENLRLMVEDWRPAGDEKEGEGVLASVLSLPIRSLPLPSQTVHATPNPELHDCRHDPGRVDWSAPGLAYVLNARQGHAVTGALRRDGFQAGYYHRQFPAPYRDLLETLYQEGEIQILVSPDPGGWRPGRASRAVWLTPPVHPRHFRDLSWGFGQVHLAFTEDAVKQALGYWSEVAVGRDDLATVYRSFVAAERLARRPLAIRELKGQLAERYPLGAEALLELAVQVFGELGLVQVAPINGEDTLLLLPVGEGKMSLEDSPTYRLHREAWHPYSEWVPAAYERALTEYDQWLKPSDEEEVVAHGSDR